MSLRQMSIQGLHRCRKACKTALILDSSAGWKLWIALTCEEAHRIASELQIESNRPACRCHANSLYALIEGLLSPGGIGITSVILDASGGDMVVATVKMQTGALDTEATCHTADASLWPFVSGCRCLRPRRWQSSLKRKTPGAAGSPAGRCGDGFMAGQDQACGLCPMNRSQKMSVCLSGLFRRLVWIRETEWTKWTKSTRETR